MKPLLRGEGFRGEGGGGGRGKEEGGGGFEHHVSSAMAM
jgi:hypothetical protein